MAENTFVLINVTFVLDVNVTSLDKKNVFSDTPRSKFEAMTGIRWTNEWQLNIDT